MFAKLALVTPNPAWPGSLDNGSEMGVRIRDFDWASTALGPIGLWPQCLRSYVGMLVSNSFASYIWWGPEHVAIYNDAFAPIPGDKHPAILGATSAEAWPEIRDFLDTLLRGVRETNRAVTMIDAQFALSRFGFLEEFYCTIAYSPLLGDSGAVAGVLSTLAETTQHVLGQRRIETLRSLAARSAETLTESETYGKIAAALSGSADLPFALLYLLDGTSRVARLATCVGVRAGDAAAPLEVDLDDATAPWALGGAIDTSRQSIVNNLIDRFGTLPSPWPESPHTALVMPITPSNQLETVGVLVAGISPRLRLDDAYREFISLAASQIANVIAGARAFETERKRADALAELDRAKSEFFSNVSHEFRTPLTLMLGPLETLLARDASFGDESRSTLLLVQRNALRLQKLVNASLDFSRGQSEESAHFEASDLAELTFGLATEFRPLIEGAGIRYVLDIAPQDCDVCVDREMWSTIVLNLLSNAFKFTFEGEIRVELHQTADSIELVVRDTGEGMPAEALPRIFERFHRSAETRSRTHEGSGIGLALVRQFARAHAGDVRVESEPGRGTTFTVTISTGSVHSRTDAAPIAPNSVKREPAFVEEAKRWVARDRARDSSGEFPEGARSSLNALKPTVLLADDNADMRDYIAQLLEPHYRVIAVNDGAAALAAARVAPPDLILTDVMMPVLDGFGLLRAIRSDAALRAIPVVMLSARAGEESAVEGLEVGADDYVVKPFGARELLARVRTTIALAQLRREYAREHRVANLFQRASLPLVLPSVPGLSFDAVYVPGQSEAQVGGDWYDAVRLVDGRVVISIGDVSGSGVTAAVTMGNMRQIIRGIAQVHADPVLMLNAADRALRLEHPDVFVTAFVGVLDPIRRTLTYASAGHPPPLMRLPDGRLEWLADTGLPLGLRHGQTENATSTAQLSEGVLLVLYTDGLTEATRDLAEGERRVEAALRSPNSVFETHPARALRQAVVGTEATADDIAILTVRVDAAPAPAQGGTSLLQHWTFSVSDAAAAQAARRAFGEELRTRGASFEDVYDAEIVVGELIGNIVRYAPGVAEIIVDWSGSLPVLHVLDHGPGFRHIALLPNDPYSESGRGLFLVATLTEDFNVRRRLDGGSHACAVLSLERSRLANAARTDGAGVFLDALLRTY